MKNFFNNIRQWYFDNHSKNFDKFSPARKRIAIAQDVLAQMKAQKFVARKSSYIRFKNLLLSEKRSESVQQHFDKPFICEVCALGACMLSIVKFKNNFNFGELEGSFYTNIKIVDTLHKYFSSKQLALIEGAFEESYNGSNYERVARSPYMFEEIIYELTPEEEVAIRNFSKRYPKYDTRLLAIMQNIIDNKGTFIP